VLITFVSKPASEASEEA